MKSLADRVRPLVIVAGRLVGLLAEIRVPYELPPPALKHHRTPSDFVARFAGICSAPIKAVCSALRVIFILSYLGEVQENIIIIPDYIVAFIFPYFLTI